MQLERSFMSKVRITVIRQEGTCNAGHQVGDKFVFEGTIPPDLCPAAWHSLYPYLRTIRFGGNFPWEKEGEAHVACPDPFNPVVFKLERIKK